MYLNTVPFALRRGRAGPGGSWCSGSSPREIELWPHRRFPLPAIQREVGDGRPLLDVRFNYHDFHQIDADDDRLRRRPSTTAPPSSRSACSAGSASSPCRPASGTSATTPVRRLGAMYRAVLEAMVADSGGDARVVCLPAGEVSVVLADGDGAVEPVSGSVLEWFEAAGFPGAVGGGGERCAVRRVGRAGCGVGVAGWPRGVSVGVRWWGCCWIGVSIWWRRCWGCGRRGRRSCRWIRRIRWVGSRPCWPMRARRCW